MTPPVLVLDSHGFAALARPTDRGARLLAAAELNGQRIAVPAVVLAETISGRAEDAVYWRALKGMTVCDTTARIAARAGELRTAAARARRKKRDLTVDAIVASTAYDLAPAIILTGDPGDMCLLTQARPAKIIPV
ncbi:MAG: PIN domain-containing protein [Bifidobacteriaceae bacterium]|nr:PIN domain-containing protein [Bifidobacteriaceae bacterium]